RSVTIDADLTLKVRIQNCSPATIHSTICFSPKNTAGAFWHNAAETWVDIGNSKDTNVVSSIVNLVSGHKPENSVDAHFMSESGVFDLFILMGPSPKDAVRQYASLTGVAPLPQYHTLGYHQCRWNYNDEDDVINVVDNFDSNDLPLDVMWLDIEYTDGKKYFTWDPVKFAHPTAMINNLTATGRKLVVIIDPHIKRESGYFLHEDALSNDFYVKNKDGNVFEGWCWPGSSSYLDLLDPKVQAYYKELYGFDRFQGTTSDVMIWNDMNEPSVFNGPEITMPKDCLHHGGWEHRHIHNVYGLEVFQTQITYDGLLKRSSDRRPFILTRAHFAGSQRSAAVWTGDNAAEWSHLQASLPMCLSEALGGISFCGADIGGFFNNPDTELLQRWYQAGLWLPFYRAHAHIDTRRREPYLFNEDVRTRIRNALRLRYAILPLWYTLFREHEITGDPVIRPLFYQYPDDPNLVDVDNQVLVGSSILARPVTEAGVSSVNIYLPGGASELWYDIEDFKQYQGSGVINLPVTLDRNPAFYRGGSIVPRKDRPRRSSTLTHHDPYTLYVALDSNKSATGTLYIDDGQSFSYRNKKYLYLRFQFKDNTLTSSLIDNTDYPTEAWVEKIVILGPPAKITKAKITSKSLGTLGLETSYDGEGRSLVVRKPGVNVREPFTLKLE
ncbi:neutral alpha-glucosidase AB, partial [Asbolus verrucosus]